MIQLNFLSENLNGLVSPEELINVMLTRENRFFTFYIVYLLHN